MIVICQACQRSSEVPDAYNKRKVTCDHCGEEFFAQKPKAKPVRQDVIIEPYSLIAAMLWYCGFVQCVLGVIVGIAGIETLGAYAIAVGFACVVSGLAAIGFSQVVTSIQKIESIARHIAKKI